MATPYCVWYTRKALARSLCICFSRSIVSTIPRTHGYILLCTSCDRQGPPLPIHVPCAPRARTCVPRSLGCTLVHIRTRFYRDRRLRLRVRDGTFTAQEEWRRGQKGEWGRHIREYSVLEGATYKAPKLYEVMLAWLYVRPLALCTSPTSPGFSIDFQYVEPAGATPGIEANVGFSYVSYRTDSRASAWIGFNRRETKRRDWSNFAYCRVSRLSRVFAYTGRGVECRWW